MPANLSSIMLSLNGAYDLLCAHALLSLPDTPFARLHPGLFAADEHRNNPVIRRLLAYWVLTYGLIRLVAGLNQNDPTAQAFAAVTYAVEAICIEHERREGGALVHARAHFVSLASAGLGLLVLSGV